MPVSSSGKDPYETIYELRSSCGRSRQPRHLEALERVELAFRDLIPPHTHPYALKPEEKQALENRVADFKNGGAGDAGVISGAKYLYRLCNIYDLIYNTNVAGAPSDKTAASDVWENLLNESGGNWLKFTDPGNRTYSGYSTISWWTDDFLEVDVVLSALRAGLFANWLIPYSFLMRCPTTAVSTKPLYFVPTVIDAFCQLVFHPMEDIQHPTAGITVDLSQTGPLLTGVREFVIKPIELQHLEFLPIEITRKMKRPLFRTHSDRNQHQLDKLITYYETLNAIPHKTGGSV